MEILHIFSPIDILVGLVSFLSGILVMIRQFKKNPLRNASIFLQVSLLMVKMAQHYFETHPDARDKLNERTIRALEKISRQFDDYYNRNKRIDQPLG